MIISLLLPHPHTADDADLRILYIAAGVNQVRWNKVSSYLIATAHDADLRIWDQRKSSVPVQYIAAHSNKVHTLHHPVTQPLP